MAAAMLALAALPGAVFAAGVTLTTVHNFAGPTTDGSNPRSPLLLAADGNYYGTTSEGGTKSDGTVFKLAWNGTLTILHDFAGADGAAPHAGLIQGSDGMLYGTCSSGTGSAANGTVFKISTTGILKTLHMFTGANNDGADPEGGVVEGNDGNYYGTTAGGGIEGWGMTYKLSSTGVFSQFYVFQFTDGWHPKASMILGKDGNFYGTASANAANGVGGVFKLTPGGAYTLLYSFGAKPAEADGSTPDAPLIQGVDGALYGATSAGGTASDGTVFRITTAGKLTTLHSFTGGAEGADPEGGLVQGIDGWFYGGTNQGGTDNWGTLYKVSAAGAFSDIYPFTFTEGWHPLDSPIIGLDGNYWMTASANGSKGDGTAFEFETGPVHNILLLDSATEAAIWQVNGDIHFNGADVEALKGGWAVVGAADFNDDGQPDLLLQNKTTGDLEVWYLNGLKAATAAAISESPGPDEKVVGIGDFHGTDTDDILFQNTTTGALTVWFMTGVTRNGVGPIAANPTIAWRVAGTGDFNGGGFSDIVLQDKTTRALELWIMDGITRTGDAPIAKIPTAGMNAVAVVNLTSSPEPNIVFQDGSHLTEWTLDGTTFASSGVITNTLAPGWDVVGP